MSWCNSEKLYGQDTEHGLVRHYPVNDGGHQLVLNIVLDNMIITNLTKVKDSLLVCTGYNTIQFLQYLNRVNINPNLRQYEHYKLDKIMR